MRAIQKLTVFYFLIYSVQIFAAPEYLNTISANELHDLSIGLSRIGEEVRLHIDISENPYLDRYVLESQGVSADGRNGDREIFFRIANAQGSKYQIPGDVHLYDESKLRTSQVIPLSADIQLLWASGKLTKMYDNIGPETYNIRDYNLLLPSETLHEVSFTIAEPTNPFAGVHFDLRKLPEGTVHRIYGSTSFQNEKPMQSSEPHRSNMWSGLKLLLAPSDKYLKKSMAVEDAFSLLDKETVSGKNCSSLLGQ